MQVSNTWRSLLKHYDSPTVLKENLLAPYFSRLNLPVPILDIGCGTGYFCELYSDKKRQIVGIDVNRQISKNSDYAFIKMDGANLQFSDSEFGSVLIINVLSCIDSEKTRVKILLEAKRVKKNNGKIYLISMSEELARKPFVDELLRTKRLDYKHISLSFKKQDGKRIDIIDNIIARANLNAYIKKSGLKIIKEISFKYKKRDIYNLYILK